MVAMDRRPVGWPVRGARGLMMRRMHAPATPPQGVGVLQTAVPAPMRLHVIYKLTSPNATNRALITNTMIPTMRKALDKYLMVSSNVIYAQQVPPPA
jgi:hypothetical protein